MDVAAIFHIPGTLCKFDIDKVTYGHMIVYRAKHAKSVQ